MFPSCISYPMFAIGTVSPMVDFVLGSWHFSSCVVCRSVCVCVCMLACVTDKKSLGCAAMFSLSSLNSVVGTNCESCRRVTNEVCLEHATEMVNMEKERQSNDVVSYNTWHVQSNKIPTTGSWMDTWIMDLGAWRWNAKCGANTASDVRTVVHVSNVITIWRHFHKFLWWRIWGVECSATLSCTLVCIDPFLCSIHTHMCHVRCWISTCPKPTYSPPFGPNVWYT